MRQACLCPLVGIDFLREVLRIDRLVDLAVALGLASFRRPRESSVGHRCVVAKAAPMALARRLQTVAMCSAAQETISLLQSQEGEDFDLDAVRCRCGELSTAHVKAFASEQ